MRPGKTMTADGLDRCIPHVTPSESLVFMGSGLALRAPGMTIAVARRPVEMLRGRDGIGAILNSAKLP